MDIAHAFAGRRVAVTGHTGFKGSWLTLMLKSLGAEVYGFALPPPAPGLFAAADVEDCLAESLIGNIVEVNPLLACLQRWEPEVVFHLAAQPLVLESYRNPVETFTTNVSGTVSCLEAIRQCLSVKAAVIVTSDKCYQAELSGTQRLNESAPLGGGDPYSVSKVCAELVVDCYRRTMLNDRPIVVSARAGNVIGGGDFSNDRLIPDGVRAVQSGQPLILRRPGSIRSWLHVLDVVRGYLMLAESILNGSFPVGIGGVNFGPGLEGEASASQVAASLMKELGGSYEAGSMESSFREDETIRIDSALARELLAWKPRFDLKSGIEQTAVWYRGWIKGTDVKKVSRQQMESFLSLPQ